MRRHLTYANVTTTILLFIVLGGGAYALDGHNSVRSDDIVDGQVKTGDLAGSAVTGAKVKANSLSPGDIDSVVAAPHGDADVLTAAPAADVPYPLVGNTWTQPADEVELLSGTVTYRTPPGQCLEFGSASAFGHGRLDVQIPGTGGGNAYLTPFPVDTVKTTQIVQDSTSLAGGGPVFLYTHNANTPRTITATINDDCDDDNFTVLAVDIDVVGVG